MARGLSPIQYLSIAAAMAFTTAISITLLAIRNGKYYNNFSIYVANNRAPVQVLVQLIAHTLAVIQLWVLKTLFNYATRIILLTR